MGDWTRALTEDEARLVAAARGKCDVLYEGRLTPHRSCGIALAETFGLPSAAYQALRRGGITGEGECGSIVAGRLILGQLFGDPDPTGVVTDSLREAMGEYADLWPTRIDRGAAPGESIVCNVLVGQFADFRGPRRARFCTALAAEIAALVAEVAVRNGLRPTVAPIGGVDWEPENGWP